MAAPSIARRQRWVPRGDAAVDASHPLAVGLLAFVLPAGIVAGAKFTSGWGASSFLSNNRIALSASAVTTQTARHAPIGNMPVLAGFTLAADIACTATASLAAWCNFGQSMPSAVSGVRRALLSYGGAGNNNIYFWGDGADYDTGIVWPTDGIARQYVVRSTSSTAVEVYQNGARIAAGSTSGSLYTIADPNTDVAIGGRHPSGTVNNTGSVGWTAIWNRSLSPNEIAMLYTDPFSMLRY